MPYRDRIEHLAQFVPHTVLYFARDKIDKAARYKITLVEQHGTGPFNRGYLRNVGFLLTSEYDYFCFHDIDYLPIWADYRYVETPTRLIWFGAEKKRIVPDRPEGFTHDYNTHFGGVVMFNKRDFQRVNGYSNRYWGWGYEDSDLRKRCEAENLPIDYRDGTYRALDHVNEGQDINRRPTPDAVRNKAVFDQWSTGTPDYKGDGLSSAKMRVLRREHVRLGDGRVLENVEKVLVELQ